MVGKLVSGYGLDLISSLILIHPSLMCAALECVLCSFPIPWTIRSKLWWPCRGTSFSQYPSLLSGVSCTIIARKILPCSYFILFILSFTHWNEITSWVSPGTCHHWSRRVQSVGIIGSILLPPFIRVSHSTSSNQDDFLRKWVLAPYLRRIKTRSML